eukprot:12594062-Ditylum_brightwellii.AAC.1
MINVQTGEAGKLKGVDVNDRLTSSGPFSQSKSAGTSRKGVGDCLCNNPPKEPNGVFEDSVGAGGENRGGSDFVSMVERGWYHGNICRKVGGGDGGYMEGNSAC